MASLSAAGIGSGLDVNSLLQQIVDAERGPKESQFTLKEARLQAELSAYGSLKGAVSTFQLAASKLKSSISFASNTVNIANKDLLSATASSVADEGSYSLEVQSLAQSHSLASVAFSELTSVIGNGTLTFDFGTTDYDPGTDFQTADDTYTSFTSNPDRSSQSVVIDNSNNTVTGVRDAINSANIGVTASIVDDGSGYRLLITSDDQGLANSLEITVEEGGTAGENLDTTGLSQLAFNSGATNVEQTQASTDAVITVNGLSISRESNTITGAIHGVTLNLRSADIGNPTQLTISQSTDNAEKNIGSFVTAYNELVTLYNGLTEYNPDTGQGGVLLGDNAPRNMINQIRREIGGSINNGNTYTSLSSIGITTQRDGTLALDSSELSNAIKNDFSSVAELFYAIGVPSDSDVSYISSGSSAVEGNYAVRVSALATHGLLTAEVVTAPITIDGTNNTFSLSVDGVSSSTITLTQAAYADMDVLAQEIEDQINAAASLSDAGLGVTVSYVTDHFEISSTSYGSDSTVSIVSQNSSLGFTANATETTGTDVSGTIGDKTGSGDGQLLTALGLTLEISGTATGSRGRVVYSQGLAGTLDSILKQFLSAEGQITSKTDRINDQIADIAEQRITLNKRVAAIETRYRAQFTALDALMGQLNTTSNFLQQQLDALPKIQIRSRN
ncbi:MAG: flagellar filament capping protein FliD [Gammaproteobacteria bacterium]|nr:flagellar filament capping protein FliD [Gammaproteobacteria bacterium]